MELPKTLIWCGVDKWDPIQYLQSKLDEWESFMGRNEILDIKNHIQERIYKFRWTEYLFSTHDIDLYNDYIMESLKNKSTIQFADLYNSYIYDIKGLTTRIFIKFYGKRPFTVERCKSPLKSKRRNREYYRDKEIFNMWCSKEDRYLYSKW